MKRQQILEGAKRIFMKFGFDAASMDDVTRETGVSKGTLYVYFRNKQELFTAIMQSEQAAFATAMHLALVEHSDVTAGLHDFGLRFISHVTEEKMIAAMRTALGVRERMPDLCQRFFAGSQSLRAILREYLERSADDGKLNIEDIDLATEQFLDLASGGFFKLRLFGSITESPTMLEIQRVIAGAVRAFMAAYGSGNITLTHDLKHATTDGNLEACSGSQDNRID